MIINNPGPVWIWLLTWPRRGIWKDFPAILAILILLLFGFVLQRWNLTKVRDRYKTLAKQAAAARNYETSRVACERLLALGSEPRVNILYDLMMAQNGLGKKEEAAALAVMIGPVDQL